MVNKKKSVKKWLLVFISLAIVLIAFEVFLRVKFGLGHTVLIRADNDFEYIAIPQEVKRFGNRIFYNQFSQRNREITENDSVLVDFFGDSVLNGGAQSDNDSLATSLLSDYWSKMLGKPALTINISAGSWGADNCFAYLQKYGNFGAKKFVLLISSHDAYDNMTFGPIVGIHSSFPDKDPLCAISEFIIRYLPRYTIEKLTKKKEKSENEFGINKKLDENQPFNSGFQNFYDYCQTNNIDLTIYLHAEKSEWKNGKYNEYGQEIIDFCNSHNIKLLKELDFNFPENVYRDNIHLNDFGQRKMFEIFKDRLLIN